MESDPKMRCEECGVASRVSKMLAAGNPFNPTEVLRGCPSCRAADKFRLLCDEPGCEEYVCCGWPSPDGYRNTCSKHYQKPELR